MSYADSGPWPETMQRALLVCLLFLSRMTTGIYHRIMTSL